MAGGEDHARSGFALLAAETSAAVVSSRSSMDCQPPTRSPEGRALSVSSSCPSFRAATATNRHEFGCLESEVRADRVLPRLAQRWIKLWRKPWHPDVFGKAHMQESVQRAARVVRHENLHLRFRQVLDVLINRPRL